jgi:hypothetical protein
MTKFADSVDRFLSFNEFRILEGKGLVSMTQARKKAIGEYESFNKTQKIGADFEEILKKLRKN